MSVGTKGDIIIYTSYFSALRHLPDNIVPVSICAKTPEWYDGAAYNVLAPSWSIFDEYKKYGDVSRYIKRFKAEVLAKLDRDEVIRDLVTHSRCSDDIAIVCYESPTSFCHRNIVAAWLSEALNRSVKEYEIYGS
jgi:hypothetical protein